MAQPLCRDALRIFRAALKAADPAAAINRHLTLEGSTLTAGGRRYQLDRFRRIFVIGAGKAGAAMAQAVERLLGARIAGGLINIKYGHNVKYGRLARLRRIELNQCGHPVPDINGVRGAERIAGIARQARADELIVCLISGGASALMPLPAPPITLEHEQRLTQLLLDCGADIREMNCLRKHISELKGGELARLAHPATVLTLILSDVIGDDLDVIGSGPTVPDRSTFADAAAILDKYRLWERAPIAIANRIRAAESETPKPGDPAFERVHNLIIGSNRLALEASAGKARELGYRPLLLSTYIEGETRDVARVHAAIAKEIRASGRPIRAPACVISGGETTVTIRGNGMGGRNQEFALAAAIDLDRLPGVAILSAGTDGTDGPTDAAGAIATGETMARARKQGLHGAAFLANNDSYHFFERVGGLIKTGPTNTNVMDVRLILVS